MDSYSEINSIISFYKARKGLSRLTEKVNRNINSNTSKVILITRIFMISISCSCRDEAFKMKTFLGAVAYNWEKTKKIVKILKYIYFLYVFYIYF
jgi:hypothetical protein